MLAALTGQHDPEMRMTHNLTFRTKAQGRPRYVLDRVIFFGLWVGLLFLALTQHPRHQRIDNLLQQLLLPSYHLSWCDER